MRRHTSLITFLLLVVFLCVACSPRAITPSRSEQIESAKSRGLNPLSNEEARRLFYANREQNEKRLMSLIQARSTGSVRDPNYRVGPADEVEINVFDVPELNVTARVNQSGFVSLPLIGAVPVEKRTEDEIESQISQRLRKYVKQPEVSVFVSHYGSQKVSVLGAVNAPGTYPLKKGKNSIFELISEAGGVGDNPSNYVVFIPTEISGVDSDADVESRAMLALSSQKSQKLGERGIEVYLDQIIGTGGGIPIDIPVKGGDMVILPAAGDVRVNGEVVKPGSYSLGRRMTLLGALAASGGVRRAADIREIQVVRTIDNKQVHLVVDLSEVAAGAEKDVMLRTGDLVSVPSDKSRRMQEDTFEGITKLINVGVGGSVL